MVLQALNRYYDLLADDPDSGIPLYGYSRVNVSYALNISLDGELLDVFPLFEQAQRGKKIIEVPRRLVVPEQVKRSSGIAPNFLCDTNAYVLGISDIDSPDKDYAIKRFDAFCQWNTKLLEKTGCLEAQAVVAFLEMYDPRHGRVHPVVATQLEGILKGGNLVFKLDGQSGYVHEVDEICQVWDSFKAQGSATTGQCLVTGKTAPIARLHPSIKGVVGANPSGATLVGFNARAYESYNHTEGQGINSPVSERATFAYTTVLNYLLAPGTANRKFTIGDTTVVYWSESNNRVYADLFAGLFQPEWRNDLTEDLSEPEADRDRGAEQRLREAAEKVRRAEPFDIDQLMDGLDPGTQFFVLGLAPNRARLSVRFFHTNPFENMVRKIMAHYADLLIGKEFDDQPTWISIRQILDETVSQKASDPKASPLMAGAVFRSILTGAPYPVALYNAVITRIRADMDDSTKRIKKISYVRAAIIKAYLTRKYRNQNQSEFKEVLCMSLNEQSTIPAYLLGRLFCVLEKAQKDAADGKLNATIKDRYFTSACASPGMVFPVLLRLSQHHISKAKYGYRSDRLIEEIMNLLDVEKNPIPAHLSLDEQGLFVLGYYHQHTALYPREESSKPENAVISES